MTMMSPFQFVCAPVLGLIGSTMLLVTWQVFWGVVVDDVEDVLLVLLVEELLVEELLGVWVMVRQMNVDSENQMLPFWPAHLSTRQAMAACEGNRTCPNQFYLVIDWGTLITQI